MSFGGFLFGLESNGNFANIRDSDSFFRMDWIMSKIKAKTHKGLAKRVRVTARGKVKRKGTFGGHLMSGKSGKRRRRVHSLVLMKSADAQKTLNALGHHKP